MRSKLYKALSALVFSSLILTFTACSQKTSTNSTKSNSQSPASASETSRNAFNTEIIDGSSAGYPAENSSFVQTPVDNSSEVQNPVTQTPDTSASNEEMEALRNYEASMQREGIIEGAFPAGDSHSAVWKVNKTEISDFNNDGHPEMIVQYYCGFPDGTFIASAEKQGIAIGVVGFKNGIMQELKTTDNFINYIRTAGAEISGWTEITDEPYIDENGNIGILVSKCNTNGSGTWLSYATFTEADSSNFCILDRLDNEVICYEFNDFFRSYSYNDNVTEISKDEAKQRFDKIRSLNKIANFKVTSSRPLSLEGSAYAMIS